jgi:hypothetical protein
MIFSEADTRYRRSRRHGPSRGAALDHDRARRTAAAGNGETGGFPVLAMTVLEDGATRVLGRNRHQRHHDLDLSVDIVFRQSLGRKNRIIDGRGVAPNPAAAILRIPFCAHSLHP